MKNWILYGCCLLIISAKGLAHDNTGHATVPIKFQENKGQWDAELEFFAKTRAMNVYVGDGKFTLGLKNVADLNRIHDVHHGLKNPLDSLQIHGHNIEFNLINSNSVVSEGHHKTDDYVNYFLGKDPTKWAGGVPQFEEVVMTEVYPNIDFALGSLGDYAKYEFRLAAGADISHIAFKISGADTLYLQDNKLHLGNSIAMLVDKEPVSWQIIDGSKYFVQSTYKLSGDTLSFEVESYNSTHPLIIDPTLIFASYTGSNSDNWGTTATYETLGNLYAGGIELTGTAPNNGYPTVGAYQTTFQGGVGTNGTDIVISKFNEQGSSLIYSTYIGGSNNEIPHSLVVNDNNELYVLGTTASDDYPVSASAYNQTFNGGVFIPAGFGTGNSNNIGYDQGSDIIITKFSTTGSALVGSTYIGGSGNDGINQNAILQHAYADEFRGEIIVDANDNCYVATSTGSNDFPIVDGFQDTYGGGLTDGVVFKFDANLSNLLWSSFIGGNEDDAAYSLQFDPSLNVFATGGSIGGSFPTTNDALNQNFMGGSADGWIAKISNNGESLLASTFVGTDQYDQSFFVQLDLQGNVYLVGQTLGDYPIEPNWVYSNPNSGQFLHKLDNDLQNSVFSTQWGSGNGGINLSLTAFLVNDCNHIFVSGWGGSSFTGSTTNGLVTTTNAVQRTTDGNDMYFIVFEDSATNVLFGSFYGGSGAGGREHVDGGTSRFDKKGIIYQAVCAGCGGSAGSFPTTPGAYSASKGTFNGGNNVNCNLGAIKYDLVALMADADLDGPLEVCVNDSIEFQNTSFGGTSFKWDFGDGNSSEEFEPKHAYVESGDYTIELIIFDSVSCIATDTDYIEIEVIPGPIASAPTVPTVCPSAPIQLSASGGTSYQWIPAAFVDNPDISDPIATVPISTIIQVVAFDECGNDTASIDLNIHPDKTKAPDDTALCIGLSGTLRASGGVSYQWTPETYLSSTTTASTTCMPNSTIEYAINIVDSFGCPRENSVKVYAEGSVPQIEAFGDTTICKGERILLTATGAENYHWTPEDWILDPMLQSTPAHPEASISYVVNTSNSCGFASETVHIVVQTVNVTADADAAVCLGDSVRLGASGARSYQWEGEAFSQPNKSQFPLIYPEESSWYFVKGFSSLQCEGQDSLYVLVHPLPQLDLKTNEDTITGLNNVLLLAEAESQSQIRWFSDGFVPCSECDSIVVYPRLKTEYFVEAVDTAGCRVVDSITVAAISKIYVPNSFSPNNDGINDLFVVKGHNIVEYEITVRNRWGEAIFESHDINRHWDGSKYNQGHRLADGVYSYEIKYTVLPEEVLHQNGTVTMLK